MPRRPTDLHALRGVLAALAPVAMLPIELLEATDGIWTYAPVGAFVLGGQLLSSALLLGGALVLPTRTRTGRVLASIGLVLATLLTVTGLPKDPAFGFVLLLSVGGLLTWIWPSTKPRPAPPATRDDVAPLARASSRGAAWVGLAAWVVAVPTDGGTGVSHGANAALVMAVGALFAARWAWIARRLGAPGPRRVMLGVALTVAGLAVGWAEPLTGLTLMATGPVLTLLGTRCTPAPTAPGRPVTAWEAVVSHPARALVATFMALGAVGAALLSLPLATTRPISFVDALFTAVSATCVTGLAVLDTPNDLTFAGQVILLALIQVGGLGILTFSTATVALLGRRLSVRQEGAMAGVLGADGVGDVFRSVREVFVVTAIAEGAGAIGLAGLFLAKGASVPTALWHGLFTSVSAFCNAGFALQSTNLVPYREDALVLHVVAALITVGGLGPALIVGLPALVRHDRAPLQARLALATSAVLLVVPTIAIAALEWSNTLAGLSVADRLHNAWFQSVTLRTAGFNSIDLEALHPATRTLMIVCMFIGGSPASTAGGIKTTTAALLGLAVIAAIRGRTDATAFGRRISHASVYKAAAIATTGLVSVGGGMAALQLTQDLPDHVLIFEIVSALGTVGLTIGGTAQLDQLGRIIVALAMFMGRVGPLTLFLLLTERESTRRATFPKESVAVG